jgi:hypothetical protein
MDTRVCFPGSKVAGHEADHSPSSNVDVENARAIPPFPYAVYCLIKYKVNFTFVLITD